MKYKVGDGMPFENEFASYEPLRRILENEKVKQFQNRMKLRDSSSDVTQTKLSFIDIDTLQKSDCIPDMVLAIDGSYQCVPVRNGYPGAEVGYVTVASVLMLMQDIKRLSKKEFIDPKKFRETEKATAFDAVFPGCNIIIDSEKSPKTSLRKMIFEQLKNSSAFSDFESLLDTYEVLLQYRMDEGVTNPPANPLEALEDDPIKKMHISLGEYTCSETGDRLYSTDALRIHELLNTQGTSGEMYGQLMLVIERLWLVHLLRAFEKKNWLPTLKNVAFVIDGSLAVYSVSAWLVKFIEKEICRINELQKKITGVDLMIIGLEKSGRFVEHFNDLDISPEGNEDMVPTNSVFLLNDAYIKKNIIFSQSSKQYGKDTYFGRKFFCKTKNGYKLVPQLACFNDAQRDITTANIPQFPRLGDICVLLNDLISNRYPNSINPLISAHAEAAIPLALGKKMFEEIAQELRKRGLAS